MALGLRTTFGGLRSGVRSTGAGASVPWNVCPATTTSIAVFANGAIVGVFGLANPTDEPVSAAAESPHLTARQLDVLRYLAAGHSTEAIAGKLGISIDTVRNHIRAIMGRLGVHSRLEAVIRAHDLGLV